jgi:DNA-binding response OmpR family regulator
MSTEEEESEPVATVLIVEDEEELAALYEVWLSERHDVRVAHDGESGLEKMTEDVDVVLLDRRLPGMSGDEVLDAIKAAGYEALVVMVTAVNPDTDIVDLPFDDYVTKPLTRAVMLGIVARMLRLDRASTAVREYHSLERRRDVLRTASERRGITDTEAFERLTTRLEAAAADAGAGLAWLKNEYYEVDHQ